MRFGRFEQATRIGAGGFGEVWKAWDPSVGRWVALKFLTSEEPQNIERFRREAKTAASLQHPNIVPIYEVGEVESSPFIAMEYVEGRTLGGRQIEPAKAAAWIRDAALALQVAHDAGIIHRDLKPQNLMVDRAGRVRVMDFGLARQVASGSTLTTSGFMVGTPCYMSPEQARGEVHAIDARADVYGLGATLYEMLTGRPPFDGADVVSIVMQVVAEAPKRPTAMLPSLPRDLETIVLKCLEKERRDRYGSARELAADLDRFLAGESVAARPASSVRVLLQTFVRRRWILVAVACCVLALTVAAVLQLGVGAAQGRLTTAQQSLVEQMRGTAATCFEAAMGMRRAGNLEGMEKYARQLEEACRQVRQSVPTLAEPHYLMGRMHRARGREREALAAQEVALALDPSHAPARYERVILRARRFEDRLQELAMGSWSRLGALMMDSGDGQYPIVQPVFSELLAQNPDLHQLHAELQDDLRKLAAASGSLSAAEVDIARGLSSWAGSDLVKARVSLESALRVTTSEEAVAALAAIDRHEGRLQEAIARLRPAADADPGCLSLREQLASAELEAGGEAVERAVEDFAAVIALDPSRAWSRMGLADSYSTLAERLYSRGEDPWDRSRRAMEEYERALAADPTRSTTWLSRASHRGNRATWMEARPAEAEAEYQAALEDFARAAESNRDSRVPARRGLTRSNYARFLKLNGRDGTGQVRLATADYEEAIRLHPKTIEAWLGRGVLNLNRASQEAAEGQNPSGALQAAADHFGNAILIDARAAYPRRLRGMTYLRAATYARAAGLDSAVYLGQARLDIEAALALAPRDAFALMDRAGVAYGELLQRIAQGLDGTAQREAMEKDFAAAITAAPRLSEPWLQRGVCRLGWARLTQTAIEEAITDLEQAVALNPEPAILLELAIARSEAADRMSRRGEDPSAAYRAAVALFDRAIRAPVAPLRRGQVLRNWGAALQNRGVDPAPLFERARADFDEAARLLPRNDEVWLERGMLTYHRALGGQDEAALYRQAIEEIGRALEINPRRAESHLSRGIVLTNIGVLKLGAGEDAYDELKAGEDALSEAFSIDPSMRALLYRGGLRVNLSQAERGRGKDGRATLEGAIDDLWKVTVREPGGEAWFYLGHAYMNLGGMKDLPDNYRLARRAYEAAARLAPGLAATCAAQVDLIRKALGE